MAKLKNETLLRLEETNNKERKREKYLVPRMWFSLFVSLFFPDRGKIPENIGNNIMITNNTYVTANNITALYIVDEFEETLPVAWTSSILSEVKDICEGVRVDITFKTTPYKPDITKSNISSKETTWNRMLSNKLMPKVLARRAARCLFTLETLRSGETLSKERVYIRVRAENGTILYRGMKAVESYCGRNGINTHRITSGILEHFKYILIMSNKRPANIKNIPGNIFSVVTKAESLPATQGANDAQGVLMGYDHKSGYMYLIDFMASASAKNILVEALSGWGKSFFLSYWISPFKALGFNISIMDIKGEYRAIVNALNGKTLSMRTSSTIFINPFVWDLKEAALFESNEVYVNRQRQQAISKMIIMSDLEGKAASKAEAFFEEMLQALYTSVGTVSQNPATWVNTTQLHPYMVYSFMLKYSSVEVRNKYGELLVDLLDRLRIFMTPSGSQGHIFTTAYSYLDVIKAKCLSFDFAMTEQELGEEDTTIFKLRVKDMQLINDAYVSYKKSLKEWTLSLREEAEIAKDWLLSVYTKDVTLRRASNQVTIINGNSIAALAANPVSKPLVDNINILCIGNVNKSSHDYLRDEFGLKESELEDLSLIQTDAEFQHRFLLVNRMEAGATSAILEAAVPEDVAKSEYFKTVDVKE